jgi:hypothetical protein
VKRVLGAGCCVLGAGAGCRVRGAGAGCGVRGADPLPRQRDYGGRGTFGHDEFGRRAGFAEAIVVHVEAGVQSEARVQRKRADEGSSGVAGFLQQRGGGLRVRRQPITAVIADAVCIRIRPGQDARVRRQCDDRVRVREVEPDSAGGERVERRRCGDAAVAVQRIAAQGVDGDQQNVLIGDAFERCARRAAEHSEEEKSNENNGEAGKKKKPQRTPRSQREIFSASFAFSAVSVFSRQRPAAARGGAPNARLASARTASASRRLPNIVNNRDASA